MPQFNYRALNDTGRQVRGQLNADNEIHLFQQLREIGFQLIDASEVRQQRFALALVRMPKSQDIIQLCVHLEQLQKAGVPLLDGLADVRDSTDQARLRDILTEVYRDVSEGNALSAAFGKHPKVFGNVFTSLIAAGEETGNLAESFTQLIKHLKWTEAVTSKVKKATRYPGFIIFMMLALFIFMMTVVVPQVVEFLTSSGTELWTITKSLIATSEFMQDYWWLVVMIPFVLFFVVKTLRKSSAGFAYQWDYWLLRLPVIGQTIKKIALSRFTHFFAIMFQSGLPILQCLETAQRVVVNRCLEEAVASVRESVQQGEALSSAMAATGQFPRLVLRMIRVGEDSGNLSATLENVTEFYDREVDDQVDALIAMAEPALILVSGAMMAWIMMGVLGPMYSNFSNIQ